MNEWYQLQISGASLIINWSCSLLELNDVPQFTQADIL